MYSVNENYLKLPGSYLFSNIAKKSCGVLSSESGCTDHPFGESVM